LNHALRVQSFRLKERTVREKNRWKEILRQRVFIAIQRVQEKKTLKTNTRGSDTPRRAQKKSASEKSLLPVAAKAR